VRRFDAVTAVNSVFYAADMAAAMRELVRVARPGGRVVVTAWGLPEKCEFLSAVMPALGPLMPPPPPGAPPPHPGALSEPGALAAVLKEAGLRVVEEGEVACPFVFPTAEASWRGNASAGVNQAAIAHSGEAAVRAVCAAADRAHMRPEGASAMRMSFSGSRANESRDCWSDTPLSSQRRGPAARILAGRYRNTRYLPIHLLAGSRNSRPCRSGGS
jgi:hypothetical protein